MKNGSKAYRKILKPQTFHIPLERRKFLKSLAVASAGFMLPGYLAEALTLTPEMTQGPYYPLAKNIPLDKDNDLIWLNDSLTRAAGIITHVSGRVLDKNGNPIRGALVELWHADNDGEYIYSEDGDRNAAADKNFQGFGQFLTGSDGAYRFRTIKAGLYHGRTRHFHFGITVPGQKNRVTTQLFWNEVPRDNHGEIWETTNENDSVLGTVTDKTERQSVIRDFTPVKDSTTGEQETTWDIVMGLTPVEPAYPETPGGSLVAIGLPVTDSKAAKPRYKILVPVYAGYSYEVYANPTMGRLGWAALPFSLTKDGKLDRNIHTATSEGALEIYVEKPSVKGFYYVAFRLPGANTGTPGDNLDGPGRPGGPGGQNGPPPDDFWFMDDGGRPPGPPPSKVK